MLPGDATPGVEAQLVASGTPLASAVLKLGEHQASLPGNAEFVGRVAPRVAVISAESSREPSAAKTELTEILQEAGATVFSTDTDGATTVESNGQTLVVRTFKNKERVIIPQRSGR